MRAIYVLMTAMVTVIGCNQPPPEQTVFEPQLRALKKAKALEGQVQQSAEQRREQAEAATAPVSAPNPGYDVQ
ncbi:MAG: hypothetical protein ACLGHO_04170 [Gammaproteobacteria bacterium]